MTYNRKYFELIHRLPYIIRYGNVPRIKNESVAEHSFLVAGIVIGLSDTYDFNLGQALQIAISHDMYESVTGDICHLMKVENQKLYKALKDAENDCKQKFPVQVQMGNMMYNESLVESKIVHLADVIQCLYYAENEIKLGNEGYMQEVKVNSLSRIKTLELDLKKHIRRN